MIDKPRLGYAALDTKAHLHAPGRILPIVFVPGIMGSRLTDPATDKLAWNPMGLPIGDGPQVFTVDYDRLTQVSSPLVPDETHPFDEDEPEFKEVAQIRHFYNLVHDFYAKFVRAIAGYAPGDGGVKIRVYCCGYDWRQDNAKSALRLAGVVDEALRETRERKVVIVAHSMGGLVSRYYCRVLGGESRVHRLFLIGSPTMGAPESYATLKHGVPGIYVKDFLQADNVKDKVAEGISEAATAEKSISTIMGAMHDPGSAGSRVKRATLGTYGLFLALCLGSGRFLKRKETVYFARQLPGVYQLLPGALYCRDHKNWLLFDPLATGHPPTGFMIVFPTILDLAVDLLQVSANALSSSMHKVGDDIKKEVDGFLKPDEATRTAPIATRNMESLVDRFKKIAAQFSGDVDKPLPGHAAAEAPSAGDALKSIVELIMRFEKSFLDCRNNRALYDDIYTGLMDVVDLRAITAANLALAYRFDEALIVDPYPVPPATPLKTFATTLLLPWFDKLFALGSQYPARADWLQKVNEATVGNIHKALGKALADQKKEEEKQAKAKAYMHPSTYGVFCSSEQVEAGGLLIPTDILSNNDSNEVQWMLFPTTLLSVIASLIPSGDHATGFSGQEWGDGTVPALSANPPAEALQRPFEEMKKVENVEHSDLLKSDEVITWFKEKIDGLVPTFLET
jgi:pimeloyl-ACP methyl ester carboxylesterase